ncbi:MAG TPA: bifunctional adenosylcobinamide kinase/adenosylcobinamide-phosphate guanylyltransferase [Nocardioides sp.]|nr:bifunctional adenosylcobinamide kinase/adenosylcobinamide-phosphate guanylyltransferase [Nocardioides sp.]
MRVRVLGTGSADGWPNPFCRCASCTTARAEGRLRGQTAALVDDELLLDCGPETPHAAQRAGVDLTRLRHVLITHGHPDHCAPAFLLFRSWAGDGPLDVLGPPDVVEQAAMWVAPDSPVRFVAVTPGERHTLGRYAVHVLPAAHGDSAVLYDVTAPDGRLLYATDTGPLPDATVAAASGASYDVVLLEETFGDKVDHGTDHLDLGSFPEQVRRLRSVGAVTERTDVVAIHLSHHNPPTPELARRLAAWGARVVDDGTVLAPGTSYESGPMAHGSYDVPPHVIRTLVIGGARSGKSREAERLLAAEPAVTYVATAYPAEHDDEWSERVRLHRDRRPAHWDTEETLDLVPLLGSAGAPLLIDCLTLWLTRVMDRHDAWSDEAWATTAEKAVAEEVDALVAAWRTAARRVVAVTNEVGQGVVPETAAGRRFRDVMGRLNAELAACTEDVRWCVAGRVTRL